MVASKETHKRASIEPFDSNDGFIVLSGGGILVVSQFTLVGDCSRGRRPGFDQAADLDTARILYEYFVELLIQSGLKVGTGRFAADMEVKLVNDGPLTFILER